MTATFTILTGIIGAVAGPDSLNSLGIQTPEARGFALVAGMVLNAILIAIIVPPIVRLMGYG